MKNKVKYLIKQWLIFCINFKIIRFVGAKLIIFFPQVKRRLQAMTVNKSFEVEELSLKTREIYIKLLNNEIP